MDNELLTLQASTRIDYMVAKDKLGLKASLVDLLLIDWVIERLWKRLKVTTYEGFWQPERTAPTGVTVFVYGVGGGMTGFKDELGNWRARHRGIHKNKPKYWAPIPLPEDDGK